MNARNLPSAPLDELWATIARSDPKDAIVDIIIPVYNQYEVTLNCIYTVLKSVNRTPYELIVIDDCSSDINLSNKLKKLSENGLFTLLYNKPNLGFTRTVNRGMQLHEDRDVILLNSDTAVYGNWVDRLHSVAYESKDIATVNPLTSSSHISGYPSLGRNDAALEVDDFTLDALASTSNSERFVKAPTTVGFCMYIKRMCLLDIGYFDEIHFPRGYGEEGDFCYRARKVGWNPIVAGNWNHVVAGNVYVRHYDGVSFGKEKNILMAQMLKKFSDLHPEFALEDERFKHDDPTKILRERLDLSRIKHFIGDNENLSVCYAKCKPNVRRLSKVYVEFNDIDSSIFSFHVDGIDNILNLQKYDAQLDMRIFSGVLNFLGIKRICAPALDSLIIKRFVDEISQCNHLEIV